MTLYELGFDAVAAAEAVADTTALVAEASALVADMIDGARRELSWLAMRGRAGSEDGWRGAVDK